jgi:CheY-like chemotaxis protein
MGKKILLADDSITIQKVIELTFSDEDFDVVTVGNGRLALEKLNDVQPDIVLCDIIMPEKDGYEVCEHVKTSERFSHIPVLLLTGAFEPFDQERAERVGSDGFLAKPFEPETLIAKVKDLLSRAQAPQAGGVPPGVTDLGVTAPQSVVSRESLSPPLEEVPPAVPPLASETAPPLGASLIPEQPFEAFDVGAGDEAPSFEAAPSAEPAESLAPVSEEELATLTGETKVVPPEPEAPDSASTVMFSAGQRPWNDEPAPPAEAPAHAEPTEAVDEGPPEPALTPEPPAAPDLAEETGAAFEEVLEEDLEFGAPRFGAPVTGSDTQVPITPEVLPDEPQDSSTFETVAPPALPELEPEPAPDLEPEAIAAEPEVPATFEAASAYSGEPPPELELDPAEASSEPEVPPVYEPPPAYEPEPPPAYEPASSSEPEAPSALEGIPPHETEAPPIFEPAPPSEPEAPAAYEPAELEPPPAFEPASSPEPEGPSAFEEIPPHAARPVFEPLLPSEPEPPPVEEAAAPSQREPVFEPIRPPTFEMPPAPDRPETTLPPLEPEAPSEGASTPPLRPELEPGPPAAGELEASVDAAPEPAADPETAPTPVFEMEPAPSPPPAPEFESATSFPESEGTLEPDSAPGLEPEPAFVSPTPFSAEPEGAPEPEPEAPAAPAEPSGGETLPGTGREQVVESFADVETGGETEELPLSPSEAASVPVPVDMVEKIAQRVVAQVSEKVVREIAWEVIPDLAEALIKQEIERLKDELQKL